MESRKYIIFESQVFKESKYVDLANVYFEFQCTPPRANTQLSSSMSFVLKCAHQVLVIFVFLTGSRHHRGREAERRPRPFRRRY